MILLPGWFRHHGYGPAGARHTALAGTTAEMVLFVHDEVVVHLPAEIADEVVAAVQASAEQANGCCSATPRCVSRSTSQ